jgi:2-furoyl-CoA dehydrogenase 2Fe-2S iron sulfur subunit
MLSGHLCRCTGYAGMVDAILETAKKRASSTPA